MESSNISESPTNATGNRGDLYNGPQLVLFFLFSAPTLVLSALNIIAIIRAKDLQQKVQSILISIFVSEIFTSLALSLIFLAHPIRELLQLNLEASLYLCGVTIALLILGGAVKVGSITFYSIFVYIFIKKGIESVKWWAVALPLGVVWAVSLPFSMIIFVFIQGSSASAFVFKGFCPIDLMPNEDDVTTGMRSLSQLGVAWLLEGFLCGSIIAVFCVLTYRYMKKRCISESSSVKRAIANNVLFLGAGAFVTISNATLYPTILELVKLLKAHSSEDQVSITELLITNYIIDILRCASSLFTPVVTLALVKPVWKAAQELFGKCCCCCCCLLKLRRHAE